MPRASGAPKPDIFYAEIGDWYRNGEPNRPGWYYGYNLRDAANNVGPFPTERMARVHESESRRIT